MMKDILNEILKKKKVEIEQLKESVPFERVHFKALETTREVISLSRALQESPHGIIAEYKKKSPSKGWINEKSDPVIVTKMYQLSGASAISILTDSNFFGGHIDHIKRVRDSINIPILRKDFIIDPYQIAQARIAGADAILLIATGLSKERCEELSEYAHTLGLEVLLEIHQTAELEFINGNIDLVGVNNRNLGTFTTRLETSMELINYIPKYKICISESGISCPETVKRLREAGFKGFLIGENFMRESNPGTALKRFIQQL